MSSRRKRTVAFLMTLVRRYAVVEICGTISALLFGVVTFYISGNMILSAISATWGENVGFYGSAAFIEYRRLSKEHGEIRVTYLGTLLRTLRNLTIEFGLAELGDTFFTRPFLMTVCQMWLGGGGIGILVGKLAADIVFYGIAGINFFLHSKFTGKKPEQDC